jgi:predicted GTPase
MLVVKDKETLHPNFVRFVEKLLRQEFGFEGTPIRVLARQISK